MTENPATNNFSLQVDNENTSFLAEAAKWGKFLSIIGFIFCGIIVLCGLFAGTFLSSFKELDPQLQTLGSIGTTGLVIYYALVSLLYFFPSFYLFNFSSKMQAALRNNDQGNLNASFKNLKSCFKFWGILMIILLCIIGIAIIFGSIAVSLIH